MDKAYVRIRRIILGADLPEGPAGRGRESVFNMRTNPPKFAAWDTRADGRLEGGPLSRSRFPLAFRGSPWWRQTSGKHPSGQDVDRSTNEKAAAS